jgi:hypothetical protein
MSARLSYKILVSMPAELKDRIHEATTVLGIPISQFIRESIESRLRALDKQYTQSPPEQSFHRCELIWILISLVGMGWLYWLHS